MYCKECKKEISKNDSLCPHCGANLCDSSGKTKAIKRVLKLFALIFALIFLIDSLGNIKHITAILSEKIDYSSLTFREVLFVVVIGLSPIVGLWMTLVLYLIARHRTFKNTPSLTFGLFAGALAMTVIRIPLAFFVLDKYWSDVFLNSITSGMSVVVCIAGVYFLLYLLKEAPKLNSLLNDSANKFSEIIAIPQSFITKLFNDQGTHNDSANHHVNESIERPVKSDRSLLVYSVLNIITLGIYGWFYIYSLANDVNIMCEDDGKKTGSLLSYILLNIITLGIYNLVWKYRVANQLAYNVSHYGLNFQENGTTVLLWYVMGIFTCGLSFFVAMHIIIKNTNAFAMVYNSSGGLET